MAGGVRNFEGQYGGKDMLGFDPRKIVIENGHNPRSAAELRKNIDLLKPQILAAGCVYQPLWVRSDAGKCILVDGESRLRAMLELIEEGLIKDSSFPPRKPDYPDGVVTVPVIHFSTAADEASRILLSLTANGGKPLERWELGRSYRRLIDMGWDAPAIAEKAGKSVRYIEDCMTLADAPEGLIEVIANDEVTESAAIAAVRKHGSKADEVIKEKIKASPGKKIARERRVVESPQSRLLRDIADEVRDALDDEDVALFGYVKVRAETMARVVAIVDETSAA